MDTKTKAVLTVCGALAAALSLIVILYLDEHVASIGTELLSLSAVLAYFAGLVWFVVRFVVRGLQRNIAGAAADLLGFAVMASLWLWGSAATTAIDHVRFSYNEHFYNAAVREQAFGNTQGFVVFDWSRSGTVLTSRMHNLVYTENVGWRMPMTPEGCQSTITHLSGKFYSQRILCG